jgi:glutamyl-tRNA reductase
MELLALGLSHRTAPVATRERAALTPRREAAVLASLAASPVVVEAAALSTCNRTELYAVASSRRHGIGVLTAALVGATAIEPGELRAARYVLTGADAARHLLRVSTSLDSMVLGESEIQGQVRHALSVAQDAGTAGPELRELFRRALIAGKRVRRETDLGRGAVSVAQAAVELALGHVGDPPGSRALLLGAGRAAEATARALVGRGVGELVVANRSEPSAGQIAERFRARPARLADLDAELAAADVVVCSTGSESTLLGIERVRAALAGRPGARIVLIDIAVPRDVDPGVRALGGVVLIDMDDLEAVVRDNAHQREREAVRAARIVDDELQRYVRRRTAARPSLQRAA